MASGFEIDLEKFDIYAKETAELFINFYGWYRMPPSVHKVLLHGSSIMREFILPIGYFSEEAQESGNKIFKAVRRYYSRTCSRKSNNEDIIHYLLISSDPIISINRLQKDKITKELSIEATNLIKQTNLNDENNDNISHASDSNSQDSYIENSFEHFEDDDTSVEMEIE